MRVIAGIWRGRRLEEPRGRAVTRPTTDRVREACASMVDAAAPGGIEGTRVLDAFGGTGALGIEMLSRGAAFAQFVDSDRGAAALIRRNLETLGAARGTWAVATADVLARAAAGRVPGGPFDIVLLDPPYATDAALVTRLIEDLAAAGALAKDAVVLYEHDAHASGATPAGFEQVRSKRYGIVGVDLLQRSHPRASQGDSDTKEQS